MQNVGAESFDYGTFKAAYDTDPRIKAMVKDFNKYGITPKTKNELETGDTGPSQSDGDSVSAMAKRATDLSDLN